MQVRARRWQAWAGCGSNNQENSDLVQYTLSNVAIVLPLIDSYSDYFKGSTLCLLSVFNPFTIWIKVLPHVDLMQVRFGSQFYVKWIGHRIKLVLLSDVGRSVNFCKCWMIISPARIGERKCLSVMLPQGITYLQISGFWRGCFVRVRRK